MKWLPRDQNSSCIRNSQMTSSSTYSHKRKTKWMNIYLLTFHNMISTWQRLTQYIRSTLGKSVDYDKAYWSQCVDLVRDYADKALGRKIGTFSGSAIAGWNTGSPFVGTQWRRIRYKKWLVPSPGDIIFFAPTRTNKYGHVAVVTKGDVANVTILEQNAGSGNGDGKGSNAVSTRVYSYTWGAVGDVVGWFTFQN